MSVTKGMSEIIENSIRHVESMDPDIKNGIMGIVHIILTTIVVIGDHGKSGINIIGITAINIKIANIIGETISYILSSKQTKEGSSSQSEGKRFGGGGLRPPPSFFADEKNGSCSFVEKQEPSSSGIPQTSRLGNFIDLMDQLSVLQYQLNVQELLRNGSRLSSLVYILMDMDAIQQEHMDYRSK